LSGLLAADEKEIVRACSENKLGLVKQIEKNNWISLMFVNGK
jgi:ribosomal protein L11 methylase PrmA